MACRGFRATAIRAEFQDGAVISLSGEVRVETAEWLLDAQSLTFADGDDVEAVEGCLTLGGATGLQVCGQNLGRSEGSWTVTEAVLSLPGGGSMNAESAQCDNNGCEISGATVPVAIALPYPVGEVDTMGRSRGFLPTRLGFRTDRGAFARQDWYQPLSQAVALKIGVNGATVGAIGIGGELSWYRPAHQPSSFELNLLHDSSGPDENRLVLDADLSWSSSRDAFGLALQGTIHSDGSLGRDLGHDTIARLRADRHVSGDLWAGFGTDRLWIASHGRRTISTTGDTPVFRRLADDTVLSPALVYRGALPNLGYSHQATIGRAVHLLNTLRFDRWVVLDSGPVRPLSEARVLGGGQLRVLTSPVSRSSPGSGSTFPAASTNPTPVILSGNTHPICSRPPSCPRRGWEADNRSGTSSRCWHVFATSPFGTVTLWDRAHGRTSFRPRRARSLSRSPSSRRCAEGTSLSSFPSGGQSGARRTNSLNVLPTPRDSPSRTSLRASRSSSVFKWTSATVRSAAGMAAWQ